MNPLLDFSGLPRFSDIRPDHITPAIDTLLSENRSLIKQITSSLTQSSWDTFVEPLEEANERLYRAWGQVVHLHAVMDSPALREVYNANLPKVTEYAAELGQNLQLFEKFKALRASAEFAGLSAARKKIIENKLRDFRLGGAELPQEKKPRFKKIQEELATLSAKFSENLLDATNAFSLFIEDEKLLSGVPADVLQAAREEAIKENKPGWKLTLQAPCYIPVMQYADNRKLREDLYHSYVTRASEFGKKEWDNSPLIVDLLKRRLEEAQLLGYKSYAEVSLVPKMATSSKEVLAFLYDLAKKSRPFAERDLTELKTFAARELGMDKLEVWDIAYVSEKLRVARYAFSEQDVKQYFPEDNVLSGMFQVVETLYGIHITLDQAPIWHPDVRFYRITDSSHRLIGQFYTDLYARASKRSGAWMDEAITRKNKRGSIQTPVAYLNCNFSSPVGGKTAFLTHDEVITLFHEFGHGLHHLLTQAEDLSISGINGVEWDAVELPSQFMENFCWEWEVVRPMTRHIDNGQPLPRALFDKMVAAKNFQSGLQMLRQIEFAVFDMRLHDDFDPGTHQSVQGLLDEVRGNIAVIFPPSYNRFQCNFSHIFAGGYAAGYYSYKWAEVLSADAYSLFEENGVLNSSIGQRFKKEILEIGGSRPAIDSFVAFRGRKPDIDALLRHNGMI